LVDVPVTAAAPLLRAGDRGAAVRDLQERLVAAGRLVRVDGIYSDATRYAVESFQAQRGLRVDGICGPETWAALIESGFALGDRLIYLCQPMLRGDDVALLQRRLNALGFDAGREDGIFGRETEAALGAFQRDAGLATDRVCGPATLAALSRLGSLAEGSVATVRERDTLRRSAQHLAGMRVFVAGDLEVASQTSAVATGLRHHNAVVGLDNSGEDPTFVATSANRFLAGAFVALVAGPDPAVRCAYFANDAFRSEGGYRLATRLTEAIAPVMPAIEPPIGRTYRLLRETRMAAVVCEILPRGDAAASSVLQHELPRLTNALVEGIRRGIEEPLDASSGEDG
jgi:N-acetylmuramoyl-L-alanine amidase